jgi:hypothetical protein
MSKTTLILLLSLAACAPSPLDDGASGASLKKGAGAQDSTCELGGHDCNPGLYCSDDTGDAYLGHCKPQIPNGQTCGELAPNSNASSWWSNASCASGWCDHYTTTCVAPNGAECYDPATDNLTPSGGIYRIDCSQFKQGLVCRPSYESALEGDPGGDVVEFCLPLGREGDRCDTTFDGECAPGFQCVADSGAVGFCVQSGY